MMDCVKAIVFIAGQIHTRVQSVKANKKSSERVSERVTALTDLVESIQQGQVNTQWMMDCVKDIVFIAGQIHKLVQRVKANKKSSERVSERVTALTNLVESIQQGQVNTQVENCLRELLTTLQSASDLILKHTEASYIERMVKSGSYRSGFDTVNLRLNDHFQVLSGALQVQHGHLLYQVFALTNRETEDETDRKEDDTELKTMLLEHMKHQQEKMDSMMTDFKKVIVMLAALDKPSAAAEGAKVITAEELTYQHPKTPFMKTKTSEVYKATYHGFPVAIKRFIGAVHAKEAKSLFLKEVETMRRFESPNILRMFGICVQDEEGPQPEFLIIMEFCETGSLRQVLDDGRHQLNWSLKARMSLDAAQGLYRLHQTEDKYKVHGCINSSKFLVADGYRVKLGGLELAKTESSLRKAEDGKEEKEEDVNSMCYSSPQALGNINHKYSKDCEIYSFGIVLWEIVTREKPFQGLSNDQICHKVSEDGFMEPLPEDCPPSLGQLVTECRAFDPFTRPSAGVLVDKLHLAAAHLDEEK